MTIFRIENSDLLVFCPDLHSAAALSEIVKLSEFSLADINEKIITELSIISLKGTQRFRLKNFIYCPPKTEVAYIEQFWYSKDARSDNHQTNSRKYGLRLNIIF